MQEITLSKNQQKIFEHIKKHGINNIIWGGRLSGRATILKALKEVNKNKEEGNASNTSKYYSKLCRIPMFK